MENFCCCSSLLTKEHDSRDKNMIEFTLEELNAYTESFRGDKLIGRGSFGPVYHGVIKGRKQERNVNGQHVAVKCSRNKVDTRTKWQAEVEHLPKAMHQNVIKLIGYCETEQKLYIVYPFMKHGTVFHKLEGLDWSRTIKIIKGVASAIQKLHGLSPPLIHRDLKLDNILLDNDFNPKLADFGNVTPEGEQIESGTKVHDIQSFGKIVLQLISKKEKSYIVGNKDWQIGDWASKTYPWDELVHFKLRSTGCSKQAAKDITEIGLYCVKAQPSQQQPTIATVLEKLANL